MAIVTRLLLCSSLVLAACTRPPELAGVGGADSGDATTSLPDDDDTGQAAADGDAGSDDTGSTIDSGPADVDGDGWSADDDCDDADATVHPGAEEVCGDEVDQDCDGVADEDCPWQGAHSVTEADFEVAGEAELHQLGWVSVFVPDIDGDGDDELLLLPDKEWDGYDETPAVGVGIYLGGQTGLVHESDADMWLTSGDHGLETLFLPGDLDADGDIELLASLNHADIIETGEHTYYTVGYFELDERGDVDVDDSLTVIYASPDDDTSLTPNIWPNADDEARDWLVLTGGRGHPTPHAALSHAPVPGGSFHQADAWLESDDTWRSMYGGVARPTGDTAGTGITAMAFTGTDVIAADGLSTSAIAVLEAAPDASGTMDDLADHVIWGRTVPGPLGRDHEGGGIRPLDAEADSELNGDGYGDLAIFDIRADIDGTRYLGCIYVFYAPLPTDAQLHEADLRLCGQEEDDYVGYYADTRSDIDGDGVFDLLAAETHSEGTRDTGGFMRLYYGPLGTGVRDSSTADASFLAPFDRDYRASVRGGGDFDGDGIDDFLVGAHQESADGIRGAGVAYLFFGRPF